MLLTITAVVFGILGLVLGAGGTQLVILGGSPYFLLAAWLSWPRPFSYTSSVQKLFGSTGSSSSRASSGPSWKSGSTGGSSGRAAA